MEDKELEKQLEDAKRKLSEAQAEYNAIAKKCGGSQKGHLKMMKEKYDGKFFRYQSPNENFPVFFFIEEMMGISSICGGDVTTYVTKCMMLEYSPEFGTYAIALANGHQFTMNDLSGLEEITKQEFLDMFDGLLSGISDIRNGFK